MDHKLLVVLLGLAGAGWCGEGLTALGFLAGPAPAAPRRIPFLPGRGLQLRNQYEERFGPRGQKLIESFGRGLLPADIKIDEELAEINNQEKRKNKSKTKKTTGAQVKPAPIRPTRPKSLA